jgi:hypothetical protein
MTMKLTKNATPPATAKKITPSKLKTSASEITKLIPTPSIAAKAVPPKESPQRKRAESKSGPPPGTTVEAIINVGFGNALFIRGEGPGLSWEKGLPMNCVEESRWVWANAKADERLVFKFLLNDAIWCQGDNFVAVPGQKLETAPVF